MRKRKCNESCEDSLQLNYVLLTYDSIGNLRQNRPSSLAHYFIYVASPSKHGSKFICLAFEFQQHKHRTLPHSTYAT